MKVKVEMTKLDTIDLLKRVATEALGFSPEKYVIDEASVDLQTYRICDFFTFQIVKREKEDDKETLEEKSLEDEIPV